MKINQPFLSEKRYSEGMVLFKSIQELEEDIIFSLLASLDIWVHFSVVDTYI